MVPNFYDQVDIKSGGRMLRAGGPCNWQQDDVWAEIQDVTVTQGDVVASSGRDLTTVRKDRDPVWWLDVDSPDQFTYGPAQTRAVATVHKKDGTIEPYEWTDDVVVDMPLRLEEIQGNVVAGFNKDWTSYLFLTLPDEPARGACLAGRLGRPGRDRPGGQAVQRSLPRDPPAARAARGGRGGRLDEPRVHP